MVVYTSHIKHTVEYIIAGDDPASFGNTLLNVITAVVCIILKKKFERLYNVLRSRFKVSAITLRTVVFPQPLPP